MSANITQNGLDCQVASGSDLGGGIDWIMRRIPSVLAKFTCVPPAVAGSSNLRKNAKSDYSVSF